MCRPLYLLPLLAVLAAGLSAHEVEHRSDLVYARPGGISLHLDAYLPTSAGPHPAVLVVHGGSWRRGHKGQLAAQAQMLAQHGFAAFAINYRLAPEHPWPAQIMDCKAAVRWIRTHCEELNVDPRRVAGFGYSAGAHLVALLGVTGPEAGFDGGPQTADRDLRLQAVVAVATPTDFRYIPARVDALGYWLGGSRARRPAAYRQAAPLTHIDADDPPMLLLHGAWDVLVPVWVPQRFRRAARQAGMDVDLMVVRSKGHAGIIRDRRALARSVKFLQQELDKAVGP